LLRKLFGIWPIESRAKSADIMRPLAISTLWTIILQLTVSPLWVPLGPDQERWTQADAEAIRTLALYEGKEPMMQIGSRW